MNNTVKCPKCGTIHELSIDAINKKLLTCPKCGAVLNKTPQDNIEHTQPSLTKKTKKRNHHTYYHHYIVFDW